MHCGLPGYGIYRQSSTFHRNLLPPSSATHILIPWFIFVWSSFLKNLLPSSPATLKMKVAGSSEMGVTLYKSVCCHSPQHKHHDLLTEVKRVLSPASCNKGSHTNVFCCHPLVAVSDSSLNNSQINYNSITLAVPELKN